jgi:hypothetical protein
MELAMVLLQAGCCIEALAKGLYWKALYWAGASILTVAVMRGLRA